MKYKIATIISYCTHDYKWLKQCIEHVKPFSDEIIVTVSDHFFSGKEEDEQLIKKSIQENPDAKFIEFEFDKDFFAKNKMQRLNDPFAQPQYYVDIENGEIWAYNQLSRLIGFQAASDDIEYVLFLDTDEITETEKFIEWLDTGLYKEYNSIRFDSYFYYLDTKYQALETEDWNGITLVKKDALTEEAFFMHSSERLNFINFVKGNRCVKTLSNKNEVMFHHYSWVRTKEEMLNKVKSWSHHKDRNWTELVEKEFERKFNPKTDTCFVHNYTYREVEPYIKIGEN